MPRITAAQKENINIMNVDLGGSMSSTQIRVKTTNNPVLIVGLGGTGVDALLATKQLINKRFELPEDATNKALAVPNNVRILAIDSDNTALNGTKKDDNQGKTGMSLTAGETVPIEGDIKRILEDIHHLPRYTKEWMDDNEKMKRLVNANKKGANGMRQSGRLLLFNKANTVINSLSAAIRSVTSGATGQLQVFVIAGISGGTGSGTFVDVPYIIREICIQNNIPLHMLGILFTPDVNTSRITDIPYHKVLHRNGFAAMKELEYLMNMPEHKYDPFKQRYTESFEVNSSEKIFDSCILISEQAADGFTQMKPEKRYDYCMHLAAETVCNFIASTDGTFNIYSFSNNVDGMTALITPSFPASKLYAAVGVSAAILPKSELLEYLAGMLFKGVSDIYNNSPDEKTRQGFVETVGLDDFNLRESYNMISPDLYESGLKTSCFLPALLKQSNKAAEETGDEYITNLTSVYENKTKEYSNVKFNELKTALEELFSNYEKGPFYVSRLVYSRNDFCLISFFENQISTLTNERDTNYSGKQLQSLKSEADTAYNAYRNSLFDILDSNRKAYFDKIRVFYECKAKRILCDNMIQLYTVMRNKLLDYNNNLIENLVGILEELKGVFSKNLDIVTGVEAATCDNSGTSYEWKMYETTSDAFREALDRASKDVDIRVATQQMMKELMNEFSNAHNKDSFDIASFMSEFISNQYSAELTKTMDDFLQDRYPRVEDRQNASLQLISDLKQRSMVNFSYTQDNVQTGSYISVSVPRDAGQIAADIQNDTELNSNIVQSQYNNRISIFRFNVALSSAYHSLMHLYEDTYFTQLENNPDGMVGQHLYSTRNGSGLRSTNWIDLPSPIHDTLRANGQITDVGYAKVKEQNRKHRDEFNRAVELGIIVEDEIRYDESITMKLVDDIVFDEANSKTLVKAKKELNDLINKIKNMEEPEKIGISKLAYIDATPVDQVRECYVKTYGAWKYVEQMLDVYDAAVSKLEMVNKAQEGMKAYENEFSSFLEALFARIIYKDKTFYRYNRNSEEVITIMNLTSIKNSTERESFYLYTLYEKYTELDSRLKAAIKKKSDAAHENDIPDEDIKMLKSINNHVTNSLEQLDGYEIELDGADVERNNAIVEFYEKLKEQTVSLLRSFEED